MSGLTFAADLGRHGALPRLHDTDRVARVRDDAPALFDALAPHPALAEFVDAVVSNSPFLARALVWDPDFVRAFLATAPDETFKGLIKGLESEAREAPSLSALMDVLRIAKARAALLIAFADLGGVWTLEDVTTGLSTLADAATNAAMSWLLRDAHEAGHLNLPDPENPREGSGVVVLAMGKLGAWELNYSSDIDLVVFFDADVAPVAEAENAQGVFVALTRQLVRVLQERTPTGYVFRVDLRLRPDAGSTQVAVSLVAAEHYYEGQGQNWERAAFIKARQIAGDPHAWPQVHRMLTAFVWRRHLDYAAIEDIHAIKRQIHAHGGHDAVAIEGHNLKLGRGGIREIEFFTQTQQLINGGRIPDLRDPGTVNALHALARHQIATGSTAQEMIESYRFLRVVEHRLQMIEDEQTHSLPRDKAGVDHIAAFMGMPEQAFRDQLRMHLTRVVRHYADLFVSEQPLSESSGNLVFTGVENDPDTLETLRRLRFSQPVVVADTVRGWHHGRIRATRNARARALLTKLVPPLLHALAKTNDPDGAFTRFDSFLRGMPAGVQLFSLLNAHPEMLDLLTEVLGMAPRFAGVLSRHPGVLDVMLDPGFYTTLPGPHRLARLREQALAGTQDLEEALEATHRFAREQGLRIGVQVLKGTARASAAGMAHAALAQAVIRGLIPLVEDSVAEAHGHVPGGALAVVGMGKLGSRELTAASDLDLILIYDHDEAGHPSDGARPLEAGPYFARLSQRLINALTAPTAEGNFYDVDMRLRPSGRSGPLATQLASFAAYQRKDAWTWEHMALTRARVIAGPEALKARIEETIRSILMSPRDEARLRADACAMRARMARESRARSPWNVKTVRGGLIDLEFIAQVLQLSHAAAQPEILHPTTVVAFNRLEACGLLSPPAARSLVAAARLHQSVAQVLSLALDGPFEAAKASPSLQLCLERAAGIAGLDRLEAELVRIQTTVCDLFTEFVGEVPPQA